MHSAHPARETAFAVTLAIAVRLNGLILMFFGMSDSKYLRLSVSESESECAIKNQLEVSLVYCTNLTKGLMEKLKNKAIEQTSIRKGSPMKGVGSMAGRI